MTGAEFKARLAARAAVAGVSLPPDLAARLESYFRVLLVWNEKMNLTGMDLQELGPATVDRLFIEPIAAARYVRPAPTVIDIGSGGGSPAIPFALAAGAENLVMVESKVRKSVFLREAARAVAQAADVVTSRFQDLLPSSLHGSAYDVVTLRAVRVDAGQTQQLTKFLKPGGRILLFRPRNAQDPPLDLDCNRVELTNTAELLIVSDGPY